MKVISLIGPEQSGKTTVVEQLSKLEKNHRLSLKLFSGVEAHQFSFLEEKWTFFDLAGGVQNLASQKPALLASDAVVIVLPSNTSTFVVAAPYFRICDDLDIPTIVFINKLDIAQKRIGDLISEIQRYSNKTIALRQVPIRVAGEITGAVDLISERAWSFQQSARSKLIPIPDDVVSRSQEARSLLLEQMSDFDDSLLEELLEDRKPISPDVYLIAKRVMMDRAMSSCIIGSAQNGNGMLRLMKLLRHEVPPVAYITNRLKHKIKQDVQFITCGANILKHIGQITLIRAISSTINSGNNLGNENIGLLMQLDLKTSVVTCEPGDVIAALKSPQLQMRLPLYHLGGETVSIEWDGPKNPNFREILKPNTDKDESKLALSLSKLEMIDPGLTVQKDPITGYSIICVHGTVHQKRIIETLVSTFDITPKQDAAPIIYKETLKKSQEKFYRHRKQSGGSGQFADVLIEARPLSRGKGFQFLETIKGASVPKNYFSAVESGVKEALACGPMGYSVIDVSVNLKDGKHHDVDSSDFAFKAAARGAMNEILKESGTICLQPISEIIIYLPEEFSGGLVKELSSLNGQILGFETDHKYKTWEVFSVLLPDANTIELGRSLSGICKGTSWFSKKFSHYEVVN